MLKEQILKYKAQKKGNNWIADKLGIDVEDVKTLSTEGSSATNFISTDLEWPKYNITYSHNVNNDKGTLQSELVLDYEPKDDVELAELHKVDLTKYKISSYWTKQQGEKFFSSLHCTLKKSSDYSAEDFAKFLENYKGPEFLPPTSTTPSTQIVDMELSIYDFHLAKKTLEGEDMEDKVQQYIQIAVDLVERVKSIYHIGKLVFPISNDFFHSDNYQNQTTALTPQDVLVGFDNEYEEGFNLLVAIIDYLQTVADNVEVILVQGNHDRTKSFYLAHGLEVYFKANKRISFQREHSVTKCTIIGNTFVGYHHGNTKIDQLPLLFSTGKDSSAFGNAKYREIHVGDKHFYMAKEIMGCRIQQIPSCSGVDRWHMDHNYVHGVRAGLALVYDKEKGKIMELESRL